MKRVRDSISLAWELSKGLKTYATGSAMIVYAVVGCLLNLHPVEKGVEVVFLALGLMGIRHGVSTSTQQAVADLLKKIKK